MADKIIKYDDTVVYENGEWVDSSYQNIEVTGGDDATNAELMAVLQENATFIPNFTETKTALQIYEDLTEEEYNALEKEPNTFYLVNDIGVYKGEKLIATNADISSLENSVSNNTELINALNTDVDDLQNNKQDKLTAGENIVIEDDGRISAAGGASITVVEELPEATEENFERGKIYTTGELLQYISKSLTSKPDLEQVATLPTAADGMATAAVGTDIYLFGGARAASRFNTIQKFSTTTGVLTTLSTTLPAAIGYATAASVGTDIYIFGGYGTNGRVNTIQKFSTTTSTLTTLSAKFSAGKSSMAAAVVGTDIYLFGGDHDSGSVNTIQKFSTTTSTLTTLSTTLPETINGMAAAVIGNDIYLFGGNAYGIGYLNTIRKFSTTTGTLMTLSTTLSETINGMAAAVIGNDIYLFGGSSDFSSRLNTIQKFSTTTATLMTLSTTLSVAACDIEAAAIGNDVYLFGGYLANSSSLNTINKVTFGFDYSYQYMATGEAVNNLISTYINANFENGNTGSY